MRNNENAYIIKGRKEKEKKKKRKKKKGEKKKSEFYVSKAYFQGMKGCV